MNLRKYRFIKIIALLMAFVWLFGSYATGTTGVHATDDFDYMGSVDDNRGDDVENDDAGNGAYVLPTSSPRSIVTWNLGLQRRDWMDGPPNHPANTVYPFNDNPAGSPRPYHPYTVTGLGSFTGIPNLGNLHHHFRTWAINHSCSVKPATEADRIAAFRVWHGTPNTWHHLELTPNSEYPFPEVRLRTEENYEGWPVPHFQYAFVQRLNFNTNFDLLGTPDDARWNAYGRYLIMGSHYDRLFIYAQAPGAGGDITNFQTLCNQLFPATPACVSRPHPVAGIQPSHNDLVHPAGYIFGGWFIRTCEEEDNGLFNANNHGSQEGRFFERDERVTTHLERTLYARWYPPPTVEKNVFPVRITPEDIEAGARLTYTITIDTGNIPANKINFVVRDTLDERLNLVPRSVVFRPTVGSNPNYLLSIDNELEFFVNGLTGTGLVQNNEIVITFQVTVDPAAELDEYDEILNVAFLWGPPGTGPICPDTGEETYWNYDDTTLNIVPAIPCDCCDCKECDHECKCIPCNCTECDHQCVDCECDCDCGVGQNLAPERENRGRGQRSTGAGSAGTAPRTGDLLSVTPFLSSILFSMSAIFGGVALRRRFKG